jgi:broad specificity phosphatase PhoE
MAGHRQHTELFLIRHGQTESNVSGLLHGATDVPLNPLGKRQAEMVAVRIQEMTDIVALYASPLRRAHDTARAIAQRTQLPLHLHPGLAEMNFGQAEGIVISEIAQLYPDIYDRLNDLEDHDVRFPEGESRREFVHRIELALDDVINAHLGKRVIVVAHGGVIAAATALMLGEQPGDWRRYSIANCSVTHFEMATTGPVAHMISDTVHLETIDIQVSSGSDGR